MKQPPTKFAVDLPGWARQLELATREVFRLMLGEELGSGNGPAPGHSLDITSMVGLAGRVCGVITVRCPARAATLIAARMLKTDIAQAGPQTWDALGEICNMVAGNFKNSVTGLADPCMISVPTVISGGDYDLHPFGGNERAEVRLTFQQMPLVVAIEVRQSKQQLSAQYAGAATENSNL